jgi:cytochrome c oxidase assembly factor CtaG
VASSSAVGWILSLVLALASRPLYPVYAHLADRPGGISALVDQRIAAGVMLVPGSLTMMIFAFVELYRWIGKDPTDGERTSPVTAGVAVSHTSATGQFPAMDTRARDDIR